MFNDCHSAESGDFLSDFAARAGDYAGVGQITVVPEEAGEPVIDFVKNINGIKTFYVAHGEEIQFATLGAPSDARPMIDPAKWKVTGKSFNETPNAVASSKVSLSGSRWVYLLSNFPCIILTSTILGYFS